MGLAGMDQNVPPEFRHRQIAMKKKGNEHQEYGRRSGLFQEPCLLVKRAGPEQDHYLAPNLSSGTAMKGCLCLGLMQKNSGCDVRGK